MTNLNAFDATCVVGRHLFLQEGAPHTAADLLADMDHHGVAEALVLDSLAHENHPVEGNTRILDVVKKQPRLHPVWAVLPSGTPDELPHGEDLLRVLRRNQVGAVCLRPLQYRFNLSDWCIDELIEPLAAAQVPVFIRYDEIARHTERGDVIDWDAVVGLCRRWPKLPVIVGEWRIRRGGRLIYRALETCPNLHLELSGYFLHRGIEYVSRNWGSQRLIYGSNWPDFPMGQTLATVARAEVSGAEKRGIAGDNLRRLMAWCEVRHPQVKPQSPADRYVAIGRGAAVPPKSRIWDCHGHLGGKACHYYIPDSDLKSTVAEMERQGVEKTCVFSFAGVFSDEVHGNTIVAEAVRQYPDRFVGFTLLNPHRGRDAMLRELERCAKLGLRGIKLIPHYQGYPETGPLIDVACQWAHERKQVILCHDWGPSAQIERLTAKYPDACFINGHTFVDYAAVIKTRPNLFICSCPLWTGTRHCERLVGQIGADKLLFGSDLQDLPIAWGLGPILFAHLSEPEKALILGGNLKRILQTHSLHP